MKKEITILTLSIIVAFTTQARLGESEHGCVARYGQPVASEGEWRTYKVTPYHIEIHFSSSTRVADMIAIQRRFNDEPVDMAAAEVKTILAANVPRGSVWFEADDTTGIQDWRLLKDERNSLYHWKVRQLASATYDAREHAKLLLISSDKDFPVPPEAKKF